MRFIRRILCAAALALAPTLPAAEPPADIPAAIEQLGDRAFDAREAASLYLWERGEAARPALREASASDDPEVRVRARDVLQRIDSGIMPDTPPETAKLLAGYPTRNADGRRSLIRGLLSEDTPAIVTVMNLLRKESDANVLDAPWEEDTLKLRLLRLTAAGRIPTAQLDTLMEMSALENPGRATDYVAWCMLTGTLDAAISRRETAARDGEQSPPARSLQARLYWAADRWGDAIRVASTLPDDPMAKWMRRYAPDFTERTVAHYRDAAAQNSTYENLAHALTYLRIAITDSGQAPTADQQAQLDEYATQLRALAAGDENDMAPVVEALLINHRVDDALALLQEREADDWLLAIYVARGDYPAVMDLIAAVDADPDRAFESRAESVADDYRLSHGDLASRRARVAELPENAPARDRLALLHQAGMMDAAYEQAVIAMQAQPESVDWIPNFAHTQGVLLWKYIAHRDSLSTVDAIAPVWRRELPALDLATLATIVQAMEKALPALPETDRLDWHALLMQAHAALGDEAAIERHALARFELSDELQDLLAAIQSAINRTDYPRAAELTQRLRELLKPGTPYAGFMDQAPAFQALHAALLARAGDDPTAAIIRQRLQLSLLGDCRTRITIGERLATLSPRHEARDYFHQVRRLMAAGNIFELSRATDLTGDMLTLDRRDPARAADLLEQAQVLLLHRRYGYHQSGTGPRGLYLLQPAQIETLRMRAALADSDPDRAIAAYHRAARLVPIDADRTIELVAGLHRLDRRQDADRIAAAMLDAMEAQLAALPDSAMLHNNYAWGAANCHMRLDRALQSAQRAVTLVPQSHAYLDTLAEVHFHRGERDQAVAAQERAVILTARQSAAAYRDRLQYFTADPIPTGPTYHVIP